MSDSGFMRIVLLTVGSRGDVEPVVALASGLARAGHEPTVATHEAFRSVVEERGLAFAPITGDPRGMIRSPQVQSLLAAGRNPVRMLRGFANLLHEAWDDYAETTVAACVDQEAIVYTALGFAGWHIGEALDIPTGMLALQPFGSTAEHLPVSVLAGRSLGAWPNRAGHALQQAVGWRLVGRLVDRWRAEALAVPRLGWRGSGPELKRRREPIIHAYSPTVVPPPSDWPAWYPTTGWLYLDRPSDWAPPASLTAFLENGEAPVYAGFGSMVDQKAAGLTELVAEALARSGRRGVLATGWGGLEPGLVDDRVLVVDDVPHSWLLPRMSLAVHHGGAGTTGAVVRAGIPHVVVPLFADQHFWARTVEGSGIGTGVDRSALGRLGSAIESVDRPTARRRAGTLAEDVADEDGVGRTVEAIERWILARA